MSMSIVLKISNHINKLIKLGMEIKPSSNTQLLV